MTIIILPIVITIIIIIIILIIIVMVIIISTKPIEIENWNITSITKYTTIQQRSFRISICLSTYILLYTKIHIPIDIFVFLLVGCLEIAR